MSDCAKGGRLTYLPPEDEREPGVLYQHPLYSLKFYEQLTAIEVRGVRFERARECEVEFEDGWAECPNCQGDVYRHDRFCSGCGARVVVA